MPLVTISLKWLGKQKLHKLTYYEVRARFDLSAQATVRCIAKVVDAYKLDTDKICTFNPHGGIAYDSRLLRYKTAERVVSLWTLDGRIEVPYVAGERQHEQLQTQQGESDLLYIDGAFYLGATCNIKEHPQYQAAEFIGVDLGIRAIAVDSDGEVFTANHLNNLRARYANLRSTLQHKGTPSSKRLLRQRRQKENRFSNDTHHMIAKRLVEKAKDTAHGIALEDLSGIRERITVRKGQRRVQHAWAFHDLRQKIEYKAKQAGVPVVLIDAKNTSRQCSVCGYTDKRNRPTQETFCCKSCGYSALADYNAAVNISRRAVVNQPSL